VRPGVEELLLDPVGRSRRMSHIDRQERRVHGITVADAGGGSGASS
jgi:hypothetical protein